MTTAFLYHRVSTNVQDTKEQVKSSRQYAEENDITVFNEYDDYGKRHHAYKRHAFQQMLADIAVMKPPTVIGDTLARTSGGVGNELPLPLTPPRSALLPSRSAVSPRSPPPFPSPSRCPA